LTGSFPGTSALNKTEILPEGHQHADFKTKRAEVECEAFTNPLQGRGHIFHAVCSSIVIYDIWKYIIHQTQMSVFCCTENLCDPVSSVGIATPYELKGRGSKTCECGFFRIHPNGLWRPPSVLCDGYRVIPGGKTVGTWRYNPQSSSTEVKE
jgi:hypothetical protein